MYLTHLAVRFFARIHTSVPRVHRLSITSAVLTLAWATTAPGWAANTTTATLAVKSGGNAVTTVVAGSEVTLTANVTLAGNPVTTGQVIFCDANAPHCTDIHRLGMAQLTITGSASISFIPGIGSFSYKAVFIPSGSHAGSVSSASALTVTGAGGYPTTTSFTSIDSLGNNLFTATVVGVGAPSAVPVGTVSFLDTSYGNAALATASLGPGIGATAFTIPATPATGDYPFGIATADFNGDGIADLAVANYYGNSVTIQLGNGDGTFSQVNASPATGVSPFGIVAADFNGDGKVDLAVANNASDSVTILLGNGNGTFAAAASPAVGNNPASLATGDFNEDGNQDLAVVNNTDNTVTILAGNGNGTFTVLETPGAGAAPYGIAVGDFNNDGHLDLAAAGSSSNQIQILLGDGTGSFTPGASSPTGADATNVTVADFNADGNADLAVTNAQDGTVSILLGDGTGNFTAQPVAPLVGTGAYGLVVADFNQDGIPDFAAASLQGETVAVQLGKGDGTFISGGTPGAGQSPYLLTVGDFNGDGVPDLATTDYENAIVTVLATQITETATATASSVTPVGVGAHLVEASYAGSDGTAPSVSSTVSIEGVAATTTSLIVSANAKPISSAPAGTVVTLTATVSGLAAVPSVGIRVNGGHPNGAPPPSLVGQVNFCDAMANDCLGIHLLGTAQITSAGTAAMSFVPGIGSHSYKAVFLVDYYGTASTSSVQPLNVTGGYPTTTTIASTGSAGNYTLTATITGESNLDIPVEGTFSFLDMSNSNALLGTAALSHATSSLSFQTARTLATGEYPYAVVTADFNGDGTADAVVVNYEDETVTVLLGKGDGTFSAAPVLYYEGIGATVGDWNADGKPDLAITSEGSQIFILLGNGDGTFTQGTPVAIPGYSYRAVTADFNGDGNADIAVTNYGSSSITIELGHGDGTFTAASASPATGGDPFGLVVADFNGDHRADLAVANESDNTVTILLGNGDGTFSASTVNVGSEPCYLVSGDFNGDGKADLAVANYDDNTVSVLQGAGDGTFTAQANLTTGSGPFALTIADFNRDGKTDLAVGNYTDGTVSIFFGNGDSTFTASTALPSSGSGPYDVVAVDLNGDGLPDLLFPDYNTDTMTVLLTQLQQAAQGTLAHVAPLGTGTHNVLASYPATPPYAASQSSSTPLTAAIGASTLALTANPGGGSDFGDQVVLTATLSPASPEGVSTNGEIITYYSGATKIGASTLTGGVATLTLNSLPIGTNSLTASYPADPNLGPSTSSAIAFVVSNNAMSFVLIGGTATTNVDSDGTATYAFMVTPGSSATFGADVTFTVAGGPAGATATFNPTHVTAGNGATAVTLTMTVGSQSAVKKTMAIARRLSPLALGILLFPFAGRFRRSGKRMAGLLCLLLLSVLTGLNGCGSNNSAPITPTPAAQNYAMTVTATSGSVSKVINLKLTVK